MSLADVITRRDSSQQSAITIQTQRRFTQQLTVDQLSTILDASHAPLTASDVTHRFHQSHYQVFIPNYFALDIRRRVWQASDDDVNISPVADTSGECTSTDSHDRQLSYLRATSSVTTLMKTAATRRRLGDPGYMADQRPSTGFKSTT